MLHDPHLEKRARPESCLSCRYFFPTPKKGHGDCRRFPPKGNYNGFPTVNPGDWCGEYEFDEHRVAGLPKDHSLRAHLRKLPNDHPHRNLAEVGLPDPALESGRAAMAEGPIEKQEE